MSKSMLKSKLIKFTGLILTVFMMVGFLPVSHVVMAAKQQRTLQHMECTANGFYKRADGYYYLNDLHAEYMWSNGLQPGRLGIGSSEAFTDEACTRKVNAPLGYNSDYYVIVYLYCSKNEYTRFFAYSSFKLDVEGFTAEYVDYEEKTDSSGYQEFWIKCKVRRTESTYAHTPSKVTVETTEFKCDRNNQTTGFNFKSSVVWQGGETFTNYKISLSNIYVDPECTIPYFDYDDLDPDGVYYVKLTMCNATPNDYRIKLFGDDMDFRFICGNRPVTAVRRLFCVDEAQRESVTFTYRIGYPTDYVFAGIDISADSLKSYKSDDILYLENPEYTAKWTGNTPSRVYYDNTVYADKECTERATDKYAPLGTNFYVKASVSIPRGNNLKADRLNNGNCVVHIEDYASGIKSYSISTSDRAEVITVVIEITKIAHVYFNSNGHGEGSSVSLYEPGYVSEPAAPTADGYVFCGWFKDKACTVPFDFDSERLNYSIVLYAKWIETPAFTKQPQDGTADKADGNYYVDWETNFDAEYYEVLKVDGTYEYPIKFTDEVDLDGGKTGFANIGMFNQDYEGTYIIRGYYSDHEGEQYVDSQPFTVLNPVEHTVYFRINYGNYPNSSITTASVVHGKTVTRPSDPKPSDPKVNVPQNYVFDGWYADPECTKSFDFSTPITESVAVYAKWVECAKVTFNCSDAAGSNFPLPDPQMVVIGGHATNPWPNGFVTPDSKYSFLGWYSDKEFTDRFYFSDPVRGDITVYGKFEYIGTYKVTVKANGYGYDKNYEVTIGQRFKKPADPSDSRYTHLGYFTDAACTQAYDFTQSVYGDLTLYNKWVSNPAVVFDMNDGSGETDTRFFRYDSAPKDSITFPQPEKNGRTLAGWYEDAECTVEFTGDEALTENITVYAKWDWEYYTITFDSQGGSEVPSQLVRYDDRITEPENPVREGYRFTGWYSDSACTVREYFRSGVGRDICLYAGWNPIMYSVVLVNDGNGSATLSSTEAGVGTDIKVMVNSGEVEKVILVTETNGAETETDITEDMCFTMPAKDVIVKVIYAEKAYSVRVDVEGEGGRAATHYEGPTGTVITLDYIVEESYELKEWKVIEGDVTIENNKFTIGTTDVKIVAVFGPVATGHWMKNKTGWWYENPDGSYPVSKWQLIDGKWYYFNDSGYMVTKWNLINGKWYYMGNDGAMRTGFCKVGSKVYYFDDDGAMRTGWLQFEDEWFYFDNDGVMKTGWVEVKDKWYYMDEHGVMCTGFRWIGSYQYYFNEDGVMQTGWFEFEEYWFFFDEDGRGVTGWQRIGFNQYYFKAGGQMAASEYIDGYWLGANGAWTYKYRASWHHSFKGWWYGDETGWYARNEILTIDGVEYAFDINGYCLNP